MLNRIRKIIIDFQNILKVYKNQLINSIVINKIDKKVKINILNLSDDNLKKGYKIYDNSLSVNDLEWLNEYFLKKETFSSNSLKLFDLVNTHFFKDIKSYLGQNAKLYKIRFNSLENSQSLLTDISGSWHTDNIGNYLKLYICLEGYGNCPTLYVPGKNLKNYKPRFSENIRLLQRFDRKKKNNTIEIKHLTGQSSLFDTINLHRGKYEKVEENIRRCIVLDFLDFDKIAQLGFLDIPKFFFMKNSKPPFRIQQNSVEIKDEDILKELIQYDFFDERFLIRKNDKVLYLWN